MEFGAAELDAVDQNDDRVPAGDEPSGGDRFEHVAFFEAQALTGFDGN